MNLAAITHQARTPMCCALDQETLQITLRTGRDADAVELIYADPYEGGIAGGEAAWQGRRAPMSPAFTLEHHQLWTTTLRPPYRRLRYCFAVHQGEECWYYYEDGLRPFLQLDNRVQCFTMPWMNPADCIAPPRLGPPYRLVSDLPRPVLPGRQRPARGPALAAWAGHQRRPLRRRSGGYHLQTALPGPAGHRRPLPDPHFRLPQHP